MPGQGLRVLDAGTGLPTAVVGRLFRELGAVLLRLDVADPAAPRYPALSWWRRDAATVDPADLDDVLAGIDVCLVGGEDHPDAAPRLDAHAIAERHPHVVVVDISGYVPGTEPSTPAVDLLVQARSGLVFEQFSGQPTQLAFGPTLYGAALLATIGAWAALLERHRTGRGSLVPVTLQQGIALFWSHLWMRAERPDREFDTVPPLDVKHLIFRCADGGHVQLVMGVPSAVAKIYRALGIEAEADPADRGAPDATRGPENYFGDRALLAEHIARLPREQVVTALNEVGIAAAPVLTPGECLTNPQAEEVGLVQTGPDGRRYAGNPVEVTTTAAGAGAAPWSAATDGGGPLAGVRVLDLGNWVAGPFASKLLADLGADVISVEPPTGLSNITGIRNVWASNRGKRSIVVDLQQPDGQEVLRRLAATADVVHHNFRPGVAERLGADAATLRALHPGLVYLHTTAYGRTGPQARNSGFDMVVQALCGHEVRAGGVGNEPVWYRAPYIDYATGALGAVAMLAGLYARTVHGAGADVHTSLLGAGMFLRGELVREADGAVRGAPLLNAQRTGFDPAECLYPTSDGWIALAVRGTAMAQRLGEALRLDLPTAPETWTDGEHKAISAALATRTNDAALEQLGTAGVWVTRCEPAGFDRLTTDPAARTAGLVITVPDERYGAITGVFGPLVRLAGRPLGPLRSAPAPGEHTHDILTELGFSPEQQRTFVTTGAVRTAPHTKEHEVATT
ncbi:CoA transferase [Georgenia sp. AZ-5]|uniref:CoA transferase n=1 Tax=Georgenia sp. AZ-5 TaxID=3367526 RepID=UPI0037546669